MSGHTSAPWSVQIVSGALAIFGNSTMPRTIVARVPNKGYPEVALHDARLIAVSPRLLAALQAIVKSLADHDDEGMIEHAEEMIEARAAIAAATGDSHE